MEMISLCFQPLHTNNYNPQNPQREMTGISHKEPRAEREMTGNEAI